MGKVSVDVMLSDGARVPQDADPSARIACTKKVVIPPKRSAVAETGLNVLMPRDHAGFITSDDDVLRERGVSAEGIVYGNDGAVRPLLVNNGDEWQTFERGDVVARLVFVPLLRASFNEIGEA